jgi:spermidine synthase
MSPAPDETPAPMSRPLLLVVVSLSGACVLALEILGTRVLGPFYGVSLFLWSALISVTLAALATGYVLGGRWADRGPRASRLSAVLTLAGLWVLTIPWLRAPLLAATEGLGLRAAVLVTSLALFFPPLALLGMVSPYAIRLAVRRVDEVGRVSGNLFAVSTLASVAAALLTGFVLIPSIGVTRLLLLVGATLLAAAALARAGGSRGGAIAALLLLLAATAAGWSAWQVAAPRPAGVLAVRPTPYAELRVADHDGLRYLLLDGGTHTVVRQDNLAPQQEYVIAAELATELFTRPGRALLVGLGGGSLARVLTVDGWRLDLVEIDPGVIEAAREFFRIGPHHGAIHLADGRRFLRTSRDTFDLIVLDAFGSGSVPFHLVTTEAFADAKARLRPGGTLVLNLEALGWDEPLVKAVAATLNTRFRHVVALPTAEPPDRLGNIVLLASDRALEIPPERLGDPVLTLSDEQEHWRVLQRMHAWNNRFTPAGGRVLTDDWNPVDLRCEEINLASRRRTRTLLPASVLGW